MSGRGEQCLILDLGNVLFRGDPHPVWEQVAAGSPLDGAELRRRVAADGARIDFETGRMRADAFFAHLAALTEYREGADAMARLWAVLFRPIPERVATAVALAGKYPLWLFSNTNPTHLEALEAASPELFRAAAGAVYSHRSGWLKPHPQSYHAVEAASGAAPADLVFLDDRPENVTAARARGWAARCLGPDDDFGAGLRALGVS